MIKKLLLTGLTSVCFLSMYGQDEYDLRAEIQELDQQTCVEIFTAKVFVGQVADYNDICGCFDVSCVNDLSDQQLKQIISAAVNIHKSPHPYASFRFDVLVNVTAMNNTIRFLRHLDQYRPLVSVINDLYLRDRISQSSGESQEIRIKSGIGMLDHYIDMIEKKQFEKLDSPIGAGVLDSLVAQPKNLQALKDMKQELSEQYSALSKIKV